MNHSDCRTEDVESCDIYGTMDLCQNDKAKQTAENGATDCSGFSAKFRNVVDCDSRGSGGFAKKPPKITRFNVRPFIYNGQSVPTAFVTPRTVSMSVQPTAHERQGVSADGRNRRGDAGSPDYGSNDKPIARSAFNNPYRSVYRTDRNGYSSRPVSTEFVPSGDAADFDRALSPFADPRDEVESGGLRKIARRPLSVGFVDDGAADPAVLRQRTYIQGTYSGYEPYGAPIRNNGNNAGGNSALAARFDSPRRPPDRMRAGMDAVRFGATPDPTKSIVGSATTRIDDGEPPLVPVLPRVRTDMPQRRLPSHLETFHSTYASPRPPTRAPTSSFLAENWIDAGHEHAIQDFHPVEIVDRASPLRSLAACPDSDDRLDELERRMRQLEGRLADRASLEVGAGVSYDLQYSQSMRDLNPASLSTPIKSATQRLTLPSASSTQGIFYQYSSSTQQHQPAGGSSDRIERLSAQIKRLQDRLDEERIVRQTLVKRNSKELLWKADENETLRCRVKELEAENQLWRTKLRLFGAENRQLVVEKDHEFLTKYQSNLRPSLSMDDLVKEKQYLEHTVHDLKDQLARVQSVSESLQVEPAPDQYVPMHRYRLLKAKSKKLLSSKCEALRAEILAKETMQVQMQLQNKELSELRQKVYQQEKEKKEHCECGASLETLDKQREKLLKAIKTCSFASSCLLGICKDLVNKKCPDQDLILGIKADNGMTSSFLQDSENSSLVKNMNAEEFYDQVIDLIKHSERSLTDMQNLMVEYYTDELVGSIDCKIQ